MEKKEAGLITKAFLMVLALGLALCGLSIFGLWYLVRPLSVGAIRAWAIMATLALVPMAFVGFLLGRREARVKMEGMTAGVNEVMKAAEQTVGIKDRSAANVRSSPIQIAVAPQLPNVVHRELSDGRGKMVDL